MPSPLSVLVQSPFRRRPVGHTTELRRVRVPVPSPIGSTDAIFLMLRRMRGPLIALIMIFAISMLGLTLIPGVDANGHGYHMSLFDAFYVVSYTGTTIGFGELPTTFTTAQRMWMTVTIYATVTGWAYSIGAVFALLQDAGFRRAVNHQRFQRKVRHLREPFYLVVGYGNAGRELAASLDRAGKRLVVLDQSPERIDQLTTDQLHSDVPALAADPRQPTTLGLAGLGSDHLAGVMAVTDDDDVNLGVVMAAHLLREDAHVVARCSHRTNLERMRDFEPDAVINPYDRYGAYLLLGLSHPVTYRLTSWLLREPGTALPEQMARRLGQGRWLVCADSAFGQEVAHDLEQAGHDVTLFDPGDGLPDVGDAVGLVAGTESDTTNLSVAAAARLEHPDIYLSVRQKSADTRALMQSFAPDSVFVATEIVASEAFARAEAPAFWHFIEHAMHQDDEWSAQVLQRIIDRVGDTTPVAHAIILDHHTAPAVCRWLDGGHEMTLGQLLADPNNRDNELALFPTVLVRAGESTHVPDLDTPLRVGDTIGLLTRDHDFDILNGNLTNDVGVEYLATGVDAPSTWVGRLVRRH